MINWFVFDKLCQIGDIGFRLLFLANALSMICVKLIMAFTIFFCV
jgi:hypothetical protein